MDSVMTIAGTSISIPYLLVINIPLHRDAEGSWWGDPLWVKDLLLHTELIEDLRLLCPQVPGNEPGWVRIECDRVSITGVSAPSRAWWWRPIGLYRKISKAVRQALVVHSGVAGWPYPLGWLAGAACIRNGRFLVIVVESSFWRLTPGQPASLTRHFQAWLFERVARFFARRANLLVVTQPQYSLLAGERADAAFLNPATWIDDEFILSDEVAEQRWNEKKGALLYAGRLTREKGVAVLLEALRGLGSVAPRVDFIGEGDLLSDCLQLSADMPHSVRVLKPVPYGREFFELLDGYSGVIVPIRSDEQPRIIFDAHARAIPVFGSDAVGVASCISDGRTGIIHTVGDSASLSRSLREYSLQDVRLREMGMEALAQVRSHTHRNMHRLRIERLRESLEGWSGAGTA